MNHEHHNADRFTRKSLRLPTHKYTAAAAYFITLRALPPDPLFELPKLRYILLETWQSLPQRFPNITLDEFVIMPDHIHFILWLDGTPGKANSLGTIIGAYKSLTTVHWLQHLKSVGKDMHYPTRIWQRNYYERVIRTNELEQTRLYIRTNPTKAKSEPPQPPS